MRKALVIGNGFTSNLIESFRNEPMMTEFYKRIPGMIDRIEERFCIFRNLELTKDDLYYVTEALFCGDNLFPGNNLYPRDDGVHIKESTRVCIIEKLKEFGFREPEKIFKEYFESYGLIYVVNSPKIVGIETYLKVVHMFIELGEFSEEDYSDIKLIANEVYFNNGKHGLDSIDNADIDMSKLISAITEFDDVYTTNYDTILDDIMENIKKFPFHLHGGFSINHLNKNPDGRYSPHEAKLIWGINAETKFNELRVGLNFNDINFNAYSFGDSQISQYFDFLKEGEYDEIYILGFSGENDDHINQRIRSNSHVKRINIYVNPQKVNDLETQVRSRILFGSGNKVVNLKSWDDFWDTVK